MGKSFLSGYIGISEPYIWVLKQEEFQIDILQTGTLPFHPVARWFASTWEVPSLQSHSWQIVVQMLLHLGVPLSPLMPGTVTLLDVLFKYELWAVDSGPLADAWLSLLASAGADMEEYVSREKYLHPSGFVHYIYPYDREAEPPRKRLIFEKGDSKCQRIRWEWVRSVESPAHLILNEFSALGYPHHTFIFPDWEYNWPFIFLEAHKNLKYPPPLSTKEREVYDSKMATLEARWARQAFRRYQRSQYSPRQIKPSRSEKRCRVPGAWVEDPFQTPYTFRYRRRSSLPWWLYLLALAVAFFASRSFLCPEGQIPMIDRMNCENSDW
jgi:hypothetical protein